MRSKESPLSFGNVERELGIGPVRLLKENSMVSRFVSSARKSGMGPERFAHVMTRNLSLLSLVMDRGIGPVRLGCLCHQRTSR